MNTMRLTMSFTTGNDDPTWFNRLPIIGSRTTSMSFRKAEPSESSNEKMSDGGPFMSGPLSRASTKGRDENGRISTEVPRRRYDGTGRPVGGVGLISSQPQPQSPPQAVIRDQDQIETYREGRNLIFEDKQGDVIAQSRTPTRHFEHHTMPLELDSKAVAEKLQHPTRRHTSGSDNIAPENSSKHKPAMAFRFDDNIIVEDEDGEVIKRYKIPKAKKTAKTDIESGHSSTANKGSIFKNWFGFGKDNADDDTDFGLVTDDEGDVNLGGKNIRLRDAKGRKLSKQQFIHELKMMDPHARRAMISQSSFFPEEDTNGGPSRKEKLAEVKAGMERVVEGLSPLTTEDSTKTTDGERIVSHPGQGSPHIRAIGRARTNTLGNAEEEETTVERRRREAALGISREETSAERRRRESALGIVGGGSEDSDDDGAPRIPRQRTTMDIQFDAQEQEQRDTQEMESSSNNGGGTEGDSAMNDNGPGTGASTPGRLIQFAEDPKGKQRQS